MLGNLLMIIFVLFWIGLIFVSSFYKYTDEMIEFTDKVRDMFKKFVKWLNK